MNSLFHVVLDLGHICCNCFSVDISKQCTLKLKKCLKINSFSDLCPLTFLDFKLILKMGNNI